MRKRDCLYLLIGFLIIMMAGCASSAKKTSKSSPAKPVQNIALNDTALFEEGISYLNPAGGNPDYTKAKINFEVLVIAHPQSKWRPLSEVLIRMIDQIRASDEKSRSSLQVTEKLQTERNRMTKELERQRAEHNALILENEQLKKDIQLLKNLELQLEKRRERSVVK